MAHSLIIISEALVLPDVLKKNYSKHGGVNLINALKPTWTLWKKASKRRLCKKKSAATANGPFIIAIMKVSRDHDPTIVKSSPCLVRFPL